MSMITLPGILSEPARSTPTPEMPSTIQFQEIPIGQHFEFRGRRYRKLALSMASDEDRNGTSFMAQTEVLPDPFSRTGPTPEPIDRPKP